MKSKYTSKYVSYAQECQIVRMYKKNIMLKDIAAAVGLTRFTVVKVLDAHGIRKKRAPNGSNKKEQEPRGTIIQQCVSGANERHKRITSLFKPTMTA